MPRDKTVATWLALLLGSFGAHRFYLHGRSDLWAWLHPWPTLLGLAGVQRMRVFGQDDLAAWALIPLLGLMLAQAMLAAIVYGLTPDERWAAHFDQPARRSGWLAVIGVVAALGIGGVVLMGTVAFAGQKFFEYQALSGKRGSATVLDPHGGRAGRSPALGALRTAAG